MPTMIRTVREDEIDHFMRFLERCYGARRGFFHTYVPDIAGNAELITEHCLVIEREGRLVSHVGTYPLEISVGPAKVLAGGIGGVGTLPDARGEGYMTRLMEESVARMRRAGWPLSVLWGDQQRYATFGYETCGVRYSLHLSARSLGRQQVGKAAMEESDLSDPADIARIGELHARLRYRVDRPRLSMQLRRRGARVFLGETGYLLTASDTPGTINVWEVVSPAGLEAEMIHDVMEQTFSTDASFELGLGETAEIDRLLPVTQHWSASPQGMFRIINWPALLHSLQPLLAERAAGLRAFEVCVGCRWTDQVDWATISWDGETLAIEEKWLPHAVEIGLRRLTALVLGGPHPGREALGAFGQLLPVPLHIPSLDHI